MSSRWPGILTRLWPWSGAVASGVLLALCFAPWNLTPLVWIALTPLICAVWFGRATTGWAGAAALGYVGGVVFFALVFHWLTALGILFSQPWLFALPLLVALLFGGYFAFWAWFLARVLAPRLEQRRFPNSGSNLAIAALGACAWVSQEWVRGWFLYGGWGWNGLGVALHADLPMIQIASLTGVLGLSWLVAFVNLMIVIVVRRILGELGPTFLKRIRWEFSGSVAIIVCVFAYGLRALFAKDPEALPLRVTAIQPNVPQTLRFSADSEDEIFQQLGNLTQLATATTTQPDLLIWPESATPRGMYADERNHRFVMDHAALGDFGFLLGTEQDEPEHGHSFNAAKLLTARGARAQTHRKMHLVPFGEFLPLRPVLAPIAGELVPSDFDAGEIATVFALEKPQIKLAALICFEDTLGNLTRRFVQNGAQLLVNVTNDGWFLESAGAEQHLQNAVFRAVENRRPLVRCTNTGVTCSVDQDGRVDRWLKPFQQGFAAREVKVPTGLELTFFTRHGDWLAHVSSALVGLMMWRAFRQRPDA